MSAPVKETQVTNLKRMEEHAGREGHNGLLGDEESRNGDGSSVNGSDILSLQDIDPAMNMKMHLVNNVSVSNGSAAPEQSSPWVPSTNRLSTLSFPCVMLSLYSRECPGLLTLDSHSSSPAGH
jgi:hypothetical protein